MSGIWITSMALQWAVILVLTLLVFSLLRQLGAMTIKINALREGNSEGPALYARLPQHAVQLVGGEQFMLGGAREKPSVIVFFSPTCGACEQLPGAIRDLHEQDGDDVDVLAVPYVDASAAEGYLAETGLQSAMVALKQDFPEHILPSHGVPFAIALATDGTVAARGQPKNLEHLREMAFAARNMAEMATTHSFRDHEWGQSVPYWQLNNARG
jgi:thiol-disulfide isomerase/thioredoxin